MKLAARKIVAPFEPIRKIRAHFGLLAFAFLPLLLAANLAGLNQAWASNEGNNAAGAAAITCPRDKIRAQNRLAHPPAPSEEQGINLPARNVVVPLAQIKEVCACFGLEALWAKIAKDPPARPFKSDGCSLWFNKWQGYDLYPACFRHDLKYWAGYPGEEVERLVADSELMIEVARIMGSTAMAETMFTGVRLGGDTWTRASFAWGYGRVRP